MNIKDIFKDKETLLVIICGGLFLCFNFSRMVGDGMLLSGMPFMLAYGSVILFTNVVPLFLVFLGFRKISPPVAFCILFLIRFPGTLFADLVIFQAPIELLAIPAYLIDLAITSILLGIYAAGISFLDRKRTIGLSLVAVSLLLFFIHIGILIMPTVLGCIYQAPEKEAHNETVGKQPTHDVIVSSPVSSSDMGVNTSPLHGTGTINISITPGIPNASVRVVNYTDIRVIGQDDPTDRINENRKKIIVDAALGDERAVALLQDGGVIEGVLHQCHPTPKNFSGPACAPALRILHVNINWDFLVDEKSRTVIFVQHDLPQGAVM